MKDWRSLSVRARSLRIASLLTRIGSRRAGACLMASICEHETGSLPRLPGSGRVVAILDNFKDGNHRESLLSPACRQRKYWSRAVATGVVSANGKRLLALDEASCDLFAWCALHDAEGLSDFSVSATGHHMYFHRATIEQRIPLATWVHYVNAQPDTDKCDVWALAPLIWHEGSKKVTDPETGRKSRPYGSIRDLGDEDQLFIDSIAHTGGSTASNRDIGDGRILWESYVTIARQIEASIA